MNRFSRLLAGALILSTLSLSPRAAEKSEDELIRDLASPNARVVVRALGKIEDEYPTTTKAIPKMRALLADSRLEVRRKAARVLGVLHAKVDEKDIQEIVKLLKSNEPAVVIDGLKALRGLDAPQTVPEMVPLLKHSHPNVIRDACRTLAVLGNKDLIPTIEPLLKDKRSAVRKDAQDAIFALRSKN